MSAGRAPVGLDDDTVEAIEPHGVALIQAITPEHAVEMVLRIWAIYKNWECTVFPARIMLNKGQPTIVDLRHEGSRLASGKIERSHWSFSRFQFFSSRSRTRAG